MTNTISLEFWDQHTFSEGERGVKNLSTLTEAIGYDDIEDFLKDNPRAVLNLMHFIADHFVEEEQDEDEEEDEDEDEDEEDEYEEDEDLYKDK